MKKLTAGIFTVLMGLVSVNAADAAVASKGYVDKEIRTLDAAYKAADEDLSDRIDQLTGGGATKDELNDAIASEVTRSNKYTDDAVAAEVTRADQAYDAKGAATAAQTAAETAAKSYTDGQIAAEVTRADGAYDAKGAATAAQTAAETAAKSYTDGQIAAEVTRANEAYDTKGAAATAEANAKDYTDAQTADITAAYEEADATALSAAKTYAKTYTDQKVAGLNLAEISRVPAACGTPGNYCTLTTNGTNFVWEVIARGDAADEELPSTDANSDRLQVTVPGVTEPTVTQ